MEGACPGVPHISKPATHRVLLAAVEDLIRGGVPGHPAATPASLIQVSAALALFRYPNWRVDATTSPQKVAQSFRERRPYGRR